MRDLRWLCHCIKMILWIPEICDATSATHTDLWATAVVWSPCRVRVRYTKGLVVCQWLSRPHHAAWLEVVKIWPRTVSCVRLRTTARCVRKFSLLSRYATYCWNLNCIYYKYYSSYVNASSTLSVENVTCISFGWHTMKTINWLAT